MLVVVVGKLVVLFAAEALAYPFVPIVGSVIFAPATVGKVEDNPIYSVVIHKVARNSFAAIYTKTNTSTLNHKNCM